MTNFFRAIGRFTIEFIRGLGATVLFLLNILLRSLDSVKRPRLTIRQLYFSGVMSILIVAVSGLFMGMVLGLQ
ncbi:MAG: ABC transporter permease, partial [Neisseriaceae bacterium]|nr:ABC transporter permease [Neisseriaceae bacterium]